MPNQIRPCTLPAHWKQTEPFDAIKIGTFLYRPVPYHTQTKKKTEYRIELFINDSDSIFSPPARDNKELEQYKFEAITTIAEAINAPVLVTQAVLAGLPQDAKLLVKGDGSDVNTKRWVECELWNDEEWWCQFSNAEEVLGTKTHFIKSNGCSKTAEYLRQFTLDGVRIKEGG